MVINVVMLQRAGDAALHVHAAGAALLRHLDMLRAPPGPDLAEEPLQEPGVGWHRGGAVGVVCC